MSTHDDLSFAVEKFSGIARLFPLPNMALFPHVMQPLHVFERRYRDLLEDAIHDDQLITMAVLAPGWERDYEGRPALYPMACVGRITVHYRLADGTYNLLLLGLRRVRLLHELTPLKTFREAEVELCEDDYSTCSLAHQQTLRQDLRKALLQILPALPETQEQLEQLLGNNVSLGILTDVVSYMLDIDMARKQLMLGEVDVQRRAQLLLSYLSEVAVDSIACKAEALCFPPHFSAN